MDLEQFRGEEAVCSSICPASRTEVGQVKRANSSQVKLTAGRISFREVRGVQLKLHDE